MIIIIIVMCIIMSTIIRFALHTLFFSYDVIVIIVTTSALQLYFKFVIKQR